MKHLRIIKASYYDPKIGPSRGTDVTEELSAEIRNDCIIYEGAYNNIFPDHFKKVKKRLKIELEYNGKRHTKFYNERGKINIPEDLGITTKKIADSITVKKKWYYNPLFLVFLSVFLAFLLSLFAY